MHLYSSIISLATNGYLQYNGYVGLNDKSCEKMEKKSRPSAY